MSIDILHKYLQTYAPTVSGVVVRIFYAIMAAYRVTVSSIDISTAYLYAKLLTLIYAWVPPYYYYSSIRNKIAGAANRVEEVDKAVKGVGRRLITSDALLELCMTIYGIQSSGYPCGAP